MENIKLAGIGNESDPYIIGGIDDLIYLSKNLYLWDKNLHFSLRSDIDAKDYEFIPIGCESILFNGVFDGRGHDIKNLTMNFPQLQGVGLFGWVGAGAKIETVTLIDVTIIGGDGVGGICGNNEGGAIKWCIVESGTIKAIDEIEDVAVGICIGTNYDDGLVYGCIGEATLITPYKEWKTDTEEDIVGYNAANFVG